MIMRVLVDGSRDLGLRLIKDRLLGNRLLEDRLLQDRLLEDRLLVNRLLVNRLLEDRLLVNGLLSDGRALQVNIVTHRGHIVGLSLVVTRMVRVEVRSVGGVRHLRLEVNTLVGRLDVAGHSDGWIGDDRIRLSVDEVGRLNGMAVLVGLIGRTSVVEEDLLTGGRNRGKIVVRCNSGNSWLGVLGGGFMLLVLSLLTRILGGSSGRGRSWRITVTRHARTVGGLASIVETGTTVTGLGVHLV